MSAQVVLIVKGFIAVLQSKKALCTIFRLSCIPLVEYPSCLQATCASNPDHNPSQIVPQVSFQQISTRPSNAVVPLTSLISPFWHSTVELLMYTNLAALIYHKQGRRKMFLIRGAGLLNVLREVQMCG